MITYVLWVACAMPIRNRGISLQVEVDGVSLLGTHMGKKVGSYMIWTKKFFFASRDVVFSENIFPLGSSSDKGGSLDEFENVDWDEATGLPAKGFVDITPMMIPTPSCAQQPRDEDTKDTPSQEAHVHAESQGPCQWLMLPMRKVH